MKATAMLAFVVLVLSMSCPASAQETNPLRWPSHRSIAGQASNALVGVTIAGETWRSFHAPDRSRALGCQVSRLLVTMAAAEIVKTIVHRVRPDQSDSKSFYSEHTALAFSMTSWNVRVSVPIGGSVGYLRMAADKHYATDVLTGAAAGLASRSICR